MDVVFVWLKTSVTVVVVEAVEVEDRDLRAVAVVPVHAPDAEVIRVVTPGAVLNHVDAPRARVLLVPNHIPDPGLIRGGPTIDPVQGNNFI